MKYESDDIFRLYTREWVIVYTTANHDGCAAATVQAIGWAEENLTGRVRDKDIQLDTQTDGTAYWVHVKVFKENMKGEFKQLTAAETHAMIHQYDEYTIVPRNSAADHEIRNYGVTKL